MASTPWVKFAVAAVGRPLEQEQQRQRRELVRLYEEYRSLRFPSRTRSDRTAGTEPPLRWMDVACRGRPTLAAIRHDRLSSGDAPRPGVTSVVGSPTRAGGPWGAPRRCARLAGRRRDRVRPGQPPGRADGLGRHWRGALRRTSAARRQRGLTAVQGLRQRSRYRIARQRGVNSAVVRAEPPARCATCARPFAAGEKARRDG